PFLAHPVLWREVNFVLAGAVGNVGDPAAVGRPGYRFFTDTGCAGQIASAAFFRRGCEYVTARRKYSALSFRRNIEISNQLADAGPVLKSLVLLAGQSDSEFLRLVRLQVKGVKITAIFKDDGIPAQARPHHVELGEVSELGDLPGRKIAAVEIEPMFGPPV